MKKLLSDVSCWHTVVCTRLLFFANLRPKESQRANSRKINGVEQKTQTEKTQHAYNLKERLQGASGQRRTAFIRDSKGRLTQRYQSTLIFYRGSFLSGKTFLRHEEAYGVRGKTTVRAADRPFTLNRSGTDVNENRGICGWADCRCVRW